MIPVFIKGIEYELSLDEAIKLNTYLTNEIVNEKERLRTIPQSRIIKIYINKIGKDLFRASYLYFISEDMNMIYEEGDSITAAYLNLKSKLINMFGSEAHKYTFAMII